ncbi:hypothetical protein [Companilactobacillus furfuricola]|uniref:hypothetical protein n=1 Tax=Companilactobacillus furfuricola TaxID=1462575 RepID=UPI000F79453F|nr:hypothetical protein [Companilactobacillus furfuricola]
MSKKQKYLLLAVNFLLLILSTYPIFFGGIVSGYDPGFHMARIRTLTSNIASGHFPNPIGFEYLDHLGYGVGFFYGNFLLYPFSLLHLMGLSLYNTYILYIIIFVGLNIFSINFLVNKLFHNWWAILISGPIYLTSFYFVSVIYLRAAIGELTAFAIIPWIILSLFKIVQGQVKYWWMLFITMSLLLVSHILSFLIVCCFALLIFLMNIKTMYKNHHIFWAFFKSLLAFLGISAVFLLPFIQQYATQKYVSTAVDSLGHDLVLVYASALNNHIFDPAQFISMNGGLLVALLIFSVGYYIFKNNGIDFHNKVITQSIIVIVIFSSLLVSENLLKIVVKIFKPVILLQIMTRLNVIILPLMTIVVASALGEMLKKSGKLKFSLAGLFLIVIAIFTVAFPIKSNMQSVADRKQDIYTLSISMGEYEPREFVKYSMRSNYQVTPKRLEQSQNYHIISNNHHEVEVALKKARPGKVILLPRLNYRGYKVQFNYDGKSVEQNAMSKDGLVATKLPNDFSKGTIRVTYKNTGVAILGWIISLISLILLILAKIRIPIYKHTRHRRSYWNPYTWIEKYQK